MKSKILFVIDNLELKYFEFNNLVTNFWFIKELLQDGFSVDVTVKNNLFVDKSVPKTICYSSYTENNDIFYDKNEKIQNINDYDVVFFRPDPPVDIDYINACYVFDFVDMEKVFVINNPMSVRSFNEKFHLNYFYKFAPENIVTSSLKEIKKFVKEFGKTVIKPLNRCFGSGVYILQDGDKNINTIVNSLTNDGKTLVMVQKYIPEAQKGDKRVLILGDKVYKNTVRKLASDDDFKFNTHEDKFFEPCELTDYEYEMAKTVASELNKKGLFLVGLDVVDNKILEINVTSPCYFIKEINALYGLSFEKEIMRDLYSLINQHVKKEVLLCK